MEQWEHLTIELQPKSKGKILRGTWDAGYFSEQIQSYGKEGWELVSCFSVAETYGWSNLVFAIFKRKMP
jgi:hypothetical protein